MQSEFAYAARLRSGKNNNNNNCNNRNSNTMTATGESRMKTVGSNALITSKDNRNNLHCNSNKNTVRHLLPPLTTKTKQMFVHNCMCMNPAYSRAGFVEVLAKFMRNKRLATHRTRLLWSHANLSKFCLLFTRII